MQQRKPFIAAYIFIYLLLGLGCNQMLQKSRMPTTDPIPGAA